MSPLGKSKLKTAVQATTFTLIMACLVAMSLALGFFLYFLVVAISFFIASERRPLFSDAWWNWFLLPSVLWCLVIYFANKW